MLELIRIKFKAMFVILMCLATTAFLPFVVVYELLNKSGFKGSLGEGKSLLIDLYYQAKFAVVNGIIHNEEVGF